MGPDRPRSDSALRLAHALFLSLARPPGMLCAVELGAQAPPPNAKLLMIDIPDGVF